MFFSPGRVNLFGGHLDYNGGPVMPTAIDRGTFIAAAPRADGMLRLTSTVAESVFEAPLDALPDAASGSWFDYPLGVVRALLARSSEGCSGLDLGFGGNLPIGSGLSSSASICVGTALAVGELWGRDLSPEDRIDAALVAEREFVGVQCGIMDPWAVGQARPGHVLWLDCKDGSWEHLPLDVSRLSIAVTDTGVQRELAASEFNVRVAECAEAFRLLQPFAPGSTCLRDIDLATLDAHESVLDPVTARRARHVVTEVARTFRARDAVRAGDLVTMGELMLATHASFRTQFEVSCTELDVLVEAAEAASGAFGARLTGAGFGGCTVTLVQQGQEADVEAELVRAFRARFGRDPSVRFFGGDEGPREIFG
tara:strand:- start:5964 stop:7067 length:1104 start_codon:yes stop_codon:yes gene_type:complete